MAVIHQNRSFSWTLNKIGSESKKLYWPIFAPSVPFQELISQFYIVYSLWYIKIYRFHEPSMIHQGSTSKMSVFGVFFYVTVLSIWHLASFIWVKTSQFWLKNYLPRVSRSSGRLLPEPWPSSSLTYPWILWPVANASINEF